MNKATKLLFAYSLKGNKSRGWHKIPTPESFNAFASKFLLPLLTKKGVTVKDKSWKAKMKEHFKNASHGYFNHYCGQQDSQGAWIDKRHEERVKLLRKNMVRHLSMDSGPRRRNLSNLGNCFSCFSSNRSALRRRSKRALLIATRRL